MGGVAASTLTLATEAAAVAYARQIVADAAAAAGYDERDPVQAALPPLIYIRTADGYALLDPADTTTAPQATVGRRPLGRIVLVLRFPAAAAPEEAAR